MPLRLIEASEDRDCVLAHLFQLYRHDLSEFDGNEPDEKGLFHTESTVRSDVEEPHIILLRGKPAGFLIFERDYGSAVDSFHLKHFFIVRCYRRLGIGEEVARILFDQFPGNWVVNVPEANEVGTCFIRQVLRRYTFKKYRELNSFDGSSRVFEFQAKPGDGLHPD